MKFAAILQLSMLLVSIAYTAAADGVLVDEPLPTGMGLRVPVPDPKSCVPAAAVYMRRYTAPAVAPAGTRTCVPSVPGPDGFCEFDEMDISGGNGVVLFGVLVPRIFC